MKKGFFASVVGISLFAVAFSVAAASIFDIEYPIPELGNCPDRTACKTYCDNPANQNACLDFAKKYQLLDSQKIEQAKNLPETGPGGCQGQEACQAYCEDSAHAEECLEFAEEHNLVSKQEIQKAKEFLEKSGPGECRGQKECREYCSDPAHQEECISFAEKNGFMSKEDAEKARKFAGRPGPGGCRGEVCKTYCEDPAHTDECLEFSEKNGFISKEEAARIKKMAITTGPGGCRGEECRTYCNEVSHQEECIHFAVENGFMSKEDAERALKFAGKPGPGGCQGRECEEYCHKPEHGEACLEFAEQNGLLPPGELQRAKKFMQATESGGPGGCRGEECRTYCENPEHRKECFEFAKKQGFIRPEDEKNFEVGQKLQQKLQEAGGPGGCKSEQDCRTYCTDASHSEECIAFAAAHGGIPKEEAERMVKEFAEQKFEKQGRFHSSEDFQKFELESKNRFEQFQQLEQQFRGPGGSGFPSFRGEFPGQSGEFPGNGPQGLENFKGPGGCSSPSECIKYCTEHQNECFSFGLQGKPLFRPPEGGIPPGKEGGRSGQFPINPIREFLNGNEADENFDHELDAISNRDEILKKQFEQFRRQPQPRNNRTQEFFNPQFGKPDVFPEQEGSFQKPPEGFNQIPLQGVGPLPGTPGVFGPLNEPFNKSLPPTTGTFAPPLDFSQPPPSSDTFIQPLIQ